MAKSEKDDPNATKWTADEFRAVIAAGITIAEARALQEAGYSSEDALDLAVLQGEQRKAAAAEAQIATAKAMQKAMKPENQTHPGISAFSKPKGDVADPRPVLPFQFFYNNYPWHKFPETQHWRELELACQVKPGKYTVIRNDRTKMEVKVEAETDADGKIEKLSVTFPVNRAERTLTPPQSVLLYQVVHSEKNPRRAYLEAMQEYLLVNEDALAEAV